MSWITKLLTILIFKKAIINLIFSMMKMSCLWILNLKFKSNNYYNKFKYQKKIMCKNNLIMMMILDIKISICLKNKIQLKILIINKKKKQKIKYNK